MSESTVILSDGYQISQLPRKNKIVILLPQRDNEVKYTTGAAAHRKRALSDNEMILILGLVKHFMEKEGPDR